jgi:hypothetical protein
MHSNDEIQRAAARAEELAPTCVPVDDTDDLRTLAEAMDAVRTGAARVRELVARERANGQCNGAVVNPKSIRVCGLFRVRRSVVLCSADTISTTKMDRLCSNFVAMRMYRNYRE